MTKPKKEEGCASSANWIGDLQDQGYRRGACAATQLIFLADLVSSSFGGAIKTHGTLIRKISITPNHVGYLYRKNRLSSKLEPGIYRFFDPLGRDQRRFFAHHEQIANSHQPGSFNAGHTSHCAFPTLSNTVSAIATGTSSNLIYTMLTPSPWRRSSCCTV